MFYKILCSAQWDKQPVKTHCGRVMHICVSKLTIIGSDNGLSPGRRPGSAPGHYLNQCWNIVNWILRNRLQWNLNQNSDIFIEKHSFENVVWEIMSISSRPQCVNVTSVSLPGKLVRRAGMLWNVPQIRCQNRVVIVQNRTLHNHVHNRSARIISFRHTRVLGIPEFKGFLCQNRAVMHQNRTLQTCRNVPEPYRNGPEIVNDLICQKRTRFWPITACLLAVKYLPNKNAREIQLMSVEFPRSPVPGYSPVLQHPQFPSLPPGGREWIRARREHIWNSNITGKTTSYQNLRLWYTIQSSPFYD